MTVVHVADDVVARIAGVFAGATPGVDHLQPSRTRTVVAAVNERLGPARRAHAERAAGGVRATGTGPATADVEIDVVVVLGRSLMEVATTVQELVVERVRALTGLEVTVAVNIVDVAWPRSPTEEES